MSSRSIKVWKKRTSFVFNIILLVTNSDKNRNTYTTTLTCVKHSLIKISFEHSGNWTAASFSYAAFVLVKLDFTWNMTLYCFLGLTLKTHSKTPCCVNFLRVFWASCLVSIGFSSRSRRSWTDRRNRAYRSYREPLPPSFPWNTNEHNVSYKVLLAF